MRGTSDKARGSFCTPRAAGVSGAEERDDDGKEKFKRAIIVVQLGSTVESIGQKDLSDVVAAVTKFRSRFHYPSLYRLHLAPSGDLDHGGQHQVLNELL